jgi:peptidoglycan/LPS O-acetylase OafA/YrhL
MTVVVESPRYDNHVPAYREPSESRSRAHLPGLDGVRGIAILSVILFHTPGIAATGSTIGKVVSHVANLGWIGVDLFFVLSGFLITGILIDQRDSPSYFRTFFSRRFLRIVPVYVAFVLFSIWLAPLVHASTAETAIKVRNLQPWYWTYLVNVRIALHGWLSVGEGTTHLWSLCVEEQFYLLWPLAVFTLSSRSLPRLAIACVAFAELSRLLMVMLGAPGEVNYVLLPTRIDALAVGAFLACTVRDSTMMIAVQRRRTLLLVISLLALMPPLIAEHTLDFQGPLTQLLALPAIAVMSGLLVLKASESTTWIGTRILRFFGRYSYGMYIWHVAVISIVYACFSSTIHQQDSPLAVLSFALLFLLVLAATTVTALVSWHMIEAPFLRLKRLFPYA